MAVEIGALRAMLSLDSAAFERGAKRAQASMNRLQRNMSRVSDRMGKIGRQMSARVTLPLATLGTVAVRSSLQTIDAQAKMAESLDTTTASMQTLARAADLAGIATGELEQIGRQLTKRLSQAANDAGPAAEALGAMGLSAENLLSLELDDRIARINAAIEATIPAAEQAAVRARIFGDEAGLLASRLDADTIRQAADEIERFGVGVSGVDADQIERANDALSAIGLAMRGIANRLAVALAPRLERIAEIAADLAERFGKLSPATQRLAGVTAALAAAAGPAAIALGAAAAAISAMTAPLAIGLGLATAAAGAFLVLGTRTSDVDEAFRAAERGQKALNAAMGTFYEKAAPNSAREAIEAANANYELAQSAIAAAEAEVAKRRSLLDEARGRTKKGARDNLNAALEELEAAEAALEDARRARDRAARSVTGSMSETMSEAAARTRELKVEVEGLDGALDGIGGGGTGGGSADRIRDAMEGMRESMGRIEDQSARINESFARTFSGIVRGASDAGEALSRMLDRFADRMLTSGFNQLFDTIGIGDALSGIFGGARAMGGPVAPGKAYLVGERGPEMMVPQSAGTIVPNHALKDSGESGVTLNFAPSIDARGADQSQVDRLERGLYDLATSFEVNVQDALRKGRNRRINRAWQGQR